jgi:hypothetical protein
MTIGFSSWRFTEPVEWQGGSDCNSLERDLLKFSCLTSSERGTGSSNLLNFKIKAKGGRGLQNLSHLWDMVFGYGYGILSFLFFDVVHCVSNMLLYSGIYIKDVQPSLLSS